MLQAFVRPSAGGVRWRQQSLRLQQLQRVAPLRQSVAVGGVRMMAGGGGGGEGGGKAVKKVKVKKPESYYKQTVILPQTGFEQVSEVALTRLPPLPLLHNADPGMRYWSLGGKGDGVMDLSRVVASPKHTSTAMIDVPRIASRTTTCRFYK